MQTAAIWGAGFIAQTHVDALRANGINIALVVSRTREGAQEFAVLLREKTGLPVVLRDERGTTLTAHNYLNETDTRGKKRKAVVDAVAATVILQDYLEYRRNCRAERPEA